MVTEHPARRDPAWLTAVIGLLSVVIGGLVAPRVVRNVLARAEEDPAAELHPENILFFSQRVPEGSYALVCAGRREPHFCNVHHVAIYIGDGRVIHSTGPTTPRRSPRVPSLLRPCGYYELPLLSDPCPLAMPS